MIKLKNIKNEDGIVSCVAYVEGCEVGIPTIYDVKRDTLTHGSLPQEYDWCTGHFAYARRALKKMVNSEVFEESKIIMWY